uniref:Thioredoxin family protein n=1 Tax=candidate division WOR-3 bacterium TaxID=2052148 RepID=A0A7C3IXT8_UNCW3
MPGIVCGTAVVVMEDFTATWCTYCPGAARGAEELKSRAFDSVAIIACYPFPQTPAPPPARRLPSSPSARRAIRR